MHQFSHFYSNLVTTLSPNIHLTPESLKIELTKNHLCHAGKNEEHSYGENLHNGGENGECSHNLNPHNTNKLGWSHQNPHGFVGADHQLSKMDESFTRRHINSHHIWQSFRHPCPLADNQPVNTSYVSSKHVWTGQGLKPNIHLTPESLKIELTKNHLCHAGKNEEHSYGENLHNGGENGECSHNLNPHNTNKLGWSHQNPHGFVGADHQLSKMDESFTRRHINSHHIWQSFRHPCPLADSQPVNTSYVSSKHVWTGQGFCYANKRPKCRLNHMDVDWGGNIEANHASGCMLSEVDWVAHNSTLSLYLEQIDHDGEAQDFFTSGLWEGLLQGKFSTSQLWGRPSNGNIFQPQEFILIIWILLLKVLQRSFKSLFPHSKISDENDFGKCVTTSHHVNANLDQLVTGCKI